MAAAAAEYAQPSEPRASQILQILIKRRDLASYECKMSHRDALECFGFCFFFCSKQTLVEMLSFQLLELLFLGAA